MPLTLQEATRADLPAWATGCYEASMIPDKPFTWIMVPPLASLTGEERHRQEAEETIGLCEGGLWDLPGVVRTKVVDESGKIVAGALYTVHDENPFEKHEETVAEWQPEGGQREYASRALQQTERARQERMTCPHIFLYIIFTLPAYRRQGAASLLMSQMTSLADKKQVPCWLDATTMAIPAYQKHGFEIVGHVDLDPQADSKELEEDEGWKYLKSFVKGTRMTHMLRPVSK